jgi:hypothetical protein
LLSHGCAIPTQTYTHSLATLQTLRFAYTGCQTVIYHRALGEMSVEIFGNIKEKA